MHLGPWTYLSFSLWFSSSSSICMMAQPPHPPIGVQPIFKVILKRHGRTSQKCSDEEQKKKRAVFPLPFRLFNSSSSHDVWCMCSRRPIPSLVQLLIGKRREEGRKELFLPRFFHFKCQFFLPFEGKRRVLSKNRSVPQSWAFFHFMFTVELHF
ncbi:hypothetical protein BKA57DRAFT_39235 [Linnemannia elongata]|nr:hypothetical protein BKA57DRAFT_39235 [Linnemannia elongata]